MYRADREAEYKRLEALYSRYIPTDTVIARLNGQLIIIDTYTRLYYSKDGQVLGKFRH